MHSYSERDIGTSTSVSVEEQLKQWLVNVDSLPIQNAITVFTKIALQRDEVVYANLP